MRASISLMGAAAALLICGVALAEDAYPSKPVRLIVPFTPGTGIDILARTLGQKLGDKWNQPVVVENRPGASGNIGTEAAARSAPDGYTLLMTANTIVLNRSLFKRALYDPIKDFAPIAPLAIGSLALTTHPSLKAHSAKEFVALAKASPGKINYGSPGNGTPHHLAMELFKLRTGIDVTHVPYKGSGGAVQDLLSGQISVMFLPIHVALPYIESKRLNLLTAGGTHRAAVTPDVPSLAEAVGVGDIDVDIWYALYAPAATPRAIIDRLNRDINALLQAPDIRDALVKQGLTPTGGTSARLAELTKSDLERWAKVVREARIEPD
jgi:tripartite-type tricarboxylate transporter receptor subunit TctC